MVIYEVDVRAVVYVQEKSHLSDLVQVLIVTFGEQCPVYATPSVVPQPHQQWNQPQPRGGYPQQQQHTPYPQQQYPGYPRGPPTTASPYPTSTTPVSFPMPTASELRVFSNWYMLKLFCCSVAPSYQQPYPTPHPTQAGGAPYPTGSSPATQFPQQPPAQQLPYQSPSQAAAVAAVVASKPDPDKGNIAMIV